MSNVVDITLGVIHRMNLSASEKKQLAEKLLREITPGKKSVLNKLSYRQQFELRVENSLVSNRKLFKP